MDFINNHRYLIVGIIVGAVAVYFVSNFTTERKLSQLQLSLDTSIDEASHDAVELALEIGRGGQMHKATGLIADCSNSERDTYEAHLARLDDGLSDPDLTELDNLFSRCAPTHAVRRTLMNMDLARRVDNFEELVNQRKQIGTYERYDDELATLNSIVRLEDDITQVSLDLVYLQREIINVLLSEDVRDSEVTTGLKKRGVELRTELSEKANAAFELRSLLSES
jgi:hypothetical protein